MKKDLNFVLTSVLSDEKRNWIRRQFQMRNLIIEMNKIIDDASVLGAFSNEESDQIKKTVWALEEPFNEIVRIIERANPGILMEELELFQEKNDQPTVYENLDQYQKTYVDKQVEELKAKIELALKVLGGVYED